MRRRVPAIIALAVLGALIAGLYFAAGSWSGLDRLRTDYLGHYYLNRAFTIANSEPLDRRAALEYLRRSRELAPNSPMLPAAAPQILMSIGQWQLAAQELARQPAADPYMLGTCLIKIGQTAKGAALLKAALQTAEDLRRRRLISEEQFAMQLNNVGYVLADAGVDLPEARAMLEIAATTLPLDPNVIDSLGWVHYRLGNFREAVFYLERAMRQHSGMGRAEVYYHLGAAYARTGRMAQANRFLRSALRLDPGHPEARAEMERLRWLLPPANTAGATPRRNDPGRSKWSNLT
ncbi:MAG: tetratricopeptide repeat protein [Armatimonadetes bacterium]|nr:tetratricopeptide repeat protein [Armatimonadota bacterium]